MKVLGEQCYIDTQFDKSRAIVLPSFDGNFRHSPFLVPVTAHRTFPIGQLVVETDQGLYEKVWLSMLVEGNVTPEITFAALMDAAREIIKVGHVLVYKSRCWPASGYDTYVTYFETKDALNAFVADYREWAKQDGNSFELGPIVDF